MSYRELVKWTTLLVFGQGSAQVRRGEGKPDLQQPTS
jgi:hypothetical protein